MRQDVNMRSHHLRLPDNNQSTHLQTIKECEQEMGTRETTDNPITDNPKLTDKHKMTGQAQHMLHRRSIDKYKEIDNKRTDPHI